MTNFKKVALTSIVILVLLIGTAIVSFAVNTGTVTKEAKLRKTASDDSIILEIIPKKEDVEILETHDEWYKVNYKKIKGYVRKEFIDVEEVTNINTTEEENQITNEIKTDETKNTEEQARELKKGSQAFVKDNTSIRVRPLINSLVVSEIVKDKKVEIITIINKWAYVNTGDSNGWIQLDMLQTEQQKKDEESKKAAEEKKKTTSRSAASRQKSTTNTANKNNETTTTTSGNASSKGQEIADYAKKFVGNKYVYGGASPSKGFDCSGLTLYVYKKYGVSLPHSATSQSKKGTTVSKSNLQPGDLVFFTNYKTGKGIGHVGIYIGGNKFVHASTEKTGVIISSLSSGSHAKRYVKAVRLVNN